MGICNVEFNRFRRVLHILLDCILEAKPKIGPDFLSKLDFSSDYIKIWVRLKITLRGLPYTKGEKGGGTTRVLLPIYTNGICGIGTFPLCGQQTVKGMVNNPLASMGMAPEYPLELLAETPPTDNMVCADQTKVQADKYRSRLPPRSRQAALAHVEVYLYDFTGVVRGGPDKRKHRMHHLFYH